MQNEIGYLALAIFDEFDPRRDNGGKELRLCFGVQWDFSFASRLNNQLVILQRNRQIEPFPKLEHSDVLSQNLGIDPDGDTDSRTIIRPPIFVGDAVHDFVAQLTAALEQVQTLSGLLPICASCKKIRGEDKKWYHLETYIESHSQAHFSHGVCPDCRESL